MNDIGYSAFLAFYCYLLMLLIQWGVATFSKAKQPKAIPGKISDDLSHESFVFRAHRTFQNSIENSALFIGTAFLGLMMNIQSPTFAIAMWLYLVSRIIHMVLYYAISTEKNPSPRSYFFMLGLIANLVMLGVITMRLIM